MAGQLKKLLVTNGDSAVEILRSAGVEADILPWRDALHLGPVPQTDDLSGLSQVRAKFLSQDYENVSEEFLQRDTIILGEKNYQQIELWFEHDLYDQLQLIQCIDLLAELDRTAGVFVVQAPSYLAMETSESILRFEKLKAALDGRMIDTARLVWSAFRKETPEEFAACLVKDLRALPFLENAVERMLQELPGPDGLTRSERQIIYSINRGVSHLGMLFARCSAMEEAVFSGDTGFFKLLSDLTSEGGAEHPLITGISEPYVSGLMRDDDRRKAFITSKLLLTPLARDVLDGTSDYAPMRSMNWWWGGTHLTDSNVWRWNWESRNLVSPPEVH